MSFCHVDGESGKNPLPNTLHGLSSDRDTRILPEQNVVLEEYRIILSERNLRDRNKLTRSRRLYGSKGTGRTRSWTSSQNFHDRLVSPSDAIRHCGIVGNALNPNCCFDLGATISQRC